MKKLIIIILSFSLLLLMLSGCAAEESATAVTGQEVVLIDGTGKDVEISAPVERIISLNSGMSALICAFGDSDKIVGRTELATFPSSMMDIPEMGKSAAYANIELLLEQNPDIVVTDASLKDDVEDQIRAAGVPILIDSTSNPERIIPIIKNFGLILDKKDKADEIAGIMEYYSNMVAERVSEIDTEENPLPLVFFQWNKLYKSANDNTQFHKPIVAAGGVNIVAGEPVSYPTMSAEWLLEKNPDVIVNRISGDDTSEEMRQKREEIISQPGMEAVNAVKTGDVYIFKADVFLTLRYPVGLLYYAKWFHPDLFQDIDPAAVHREFTEKFYGMEEWNKITEAFVYPE
ncbi:ABC transporter substrate-binding protein [Chloroflexota bacterium]